MSLYPFGIVDDIVVSHDISTDSLDRFYVGAVVLSYCMITSRSFGIMYVYSCFRILIMTVSMGTVSRALDLWRSDARISGDS